MELKLCFPADNPPLAVVVAAKIGGFSFYADSSLPCGSPPTLLSPDGMKLQGLYVLLRYMGRAGKIPKFYHRDAFESSQIDEWLEYASVFSSGSEFEGEHGFVDGYLLQRTFLVGHYLSIADIAIWSALADHVTVNFVRSGGPGSQNVNKVSTKVDTRFNIKNADWLSERVKERILQMGQH